jgi:hypothetical protein
MYLTAFAGLEADDLNVLLFCIFQRLSRIIEYANNFVSYGVSHNYFSHPVLPPVIQFFILLLIHDDADNMILSHEGKLPLPMRFIVVTITQAH